MTRLEVGKQGTLGYYLSEGSGYECMYFREGVPELRNCSPTWFPTVKAAAASATEAGYGLAVETVEVLRWMIEDLNHENAQLREAFREAFNWPTRWSMPSDNNEFHSHHADAIASLKVRP